MSAASISLMHLASIGQEAGPGLGLTRLHRLAPGAEDPVTGHNVGVGGDTLGHAQDLNLTTTIRSDYRDQLFVLHLC